MTGRRLRIAAPVLAVARVGVAAHLLIVVALVVGGERRRLAAVVLAALTTLRVIRDPLPALEPHAH